MSKHRWITKLPGGIYHAPERGYVEIEHGSSECRLHWTSHRDYHFRVLNPPSFILVLNTDGELIEYYDQAISMWMRWSSRYNVGTEHYHQEGLESLELMADFLQTALEPQLPSGKSFPLTLFVSCILHGALLWILL